MEVVDIGTLALGKLDIGTLGPAGACTDNVAGIPKSTAPSPTPEPSHQNSQSRESRRLRCQKEFLHIRSETLLWVHAHD